MINFITSPDKFADLFNIKVPGAYREITASDIRDMTTCGIIGRYGYFIHLDIETVRRILQYEQLRENRQRRDEIRESDGAIRCGRCGVVMPRLMVGREDHGNTAPSVSHSGGGSDKRNGNRKETDYR